jgi:dynactin 1
VKRGAPPSNPRPRPSLPPQTSKRLSTAPSPSPGPVRTAARPSLVVSSRSQAPISVGATTPLNRRSSIVPSVKRGSPSKDNTRPPINTVSSTSVTSPSRSSGMHDKKVEELGTKLRILEQKRSEDREKLSALDRVQQERDQFESIIHKLQAKLQPLHLENADLKRSLKDAEATLERIESIQAEHESEMEMATLDREMAEEQAEALRTELEGLRSRTEELELENEILKEENGELGKEMSPEERTSQGWLQMERENDRLRQAILRLRDLTQEEIADLKEQVHSLEKDSEVHSNMKLELDDTKATLLEREADVEDLRLQLDAALGAEDMIEELTETNLTLKEQIEEIKLERDDLQTLKEINDELEIQHMEQEKQLQDEINYKDILLAEQSRHLLQKDDALIDQEQTIAKFRELVSNMQTDLEELKASKEMSESEAQELNNQSKAILDLNRRLQATAVNSRAKTIEMELRKLDAQEAAQHLEIVQRYLPESFLSERKSVLALLCWKRIGFKANLIHESVRDDIASPAGVEQGDAAFEACAVLDKLTWIAAMCDRFINFISQSTPEKFIRFESSLYDLEPVERSFNSYIDRLKKNEFKAKQVNSELHG